MTALPRLLLLLACAASSLAFAAEPDAKPQWPLWDGSESVEQYAQRVNLPPTKTLDLGNGVKLELVLIPAGEFIMGTPEPSFYDLSKFSMRIAKAQLVLGIGIFALLVAVLYVGGNAILRRRRPQISLLGLLGVVLAGAVAVLGGVRWYQAREERRLEYEQCEREAMRFTQAGDNEKPAHAVTLTRPVYMGKYDVTQEQYEQVIGANPSYFKGKNNPVDWVPWLDAQEFCKKVSQSTGQALRLPTEAEWEYACRAGTQTLYYSGDTEADLDRAGWYYGNSKDTTHPVGRKAANAWGVYDMHGNVWQWCQDWYGKDYYGKSEAENPQGPAQGAARVLRGGSWGSSLVGYRSASRYWYNPEGREYDVGCLGFRVVVSVAPKAP